MTFLRFYLQHAGVDLELKNFTASLSDLVVETFQLLSRVWVKVGGGKELAVDADQLDWGTGRPGTGGRRRRRWCGLRHRLGHHVFRGRRRPGRRSTCLAQY